MYAIRKLLRIIKPFKLDPVREALDALGVQGMTISDVKGYGRQKGHVAMYRGHEYEISYIPKVKVRITSYNVCYTKLLRLFQGTTDSFFGNDHLFLRGKINNMMCAPTKKSPNKQNKNNFKPF